jgi:methylenetetrahydrofolate dehydrogenase (NADP+)/methenyltetrahydrofolate cyclohydrolase
MYAKSRGASVTILEKNTANNPSVIAGADILILGAGVPNLVEANMVKDSVIIFDAGTSEEGGMIVGDAHPDVVSKAKLLTPVPGGIGPVTIAVLLRNLYRLKISHSRKD